MIDGLSAKFKAVPARVALVLQLVLKFAVKRKWLTRSPLTDYAPDAAINTWLAGADRTRPQACRDAPVWGTRRRRGGDVARLLHVLGRIGREMELIASAARNRNRSKPWWVFKCAKHATCTIPMLHLFVAPAPFEDWGEHPYDDKGQRSAFARPRRLRVTSPAR